MRIDLDHLRIFRVVVETGSFSAAAEVLHISQPAVSRTMNLLEARIGTPLFIRHARGVELLPAGERVYDFSVRVVEEVSILERCLNPATEKHPEGEIKIVTTPGLGSVWLTQYLPEFYDRYPKVSIKIQAQMKDIDVSDADVAIRTFIPYHSDLSQHLLKTFNMGLFASPQYLEKHGTPEKPEDLDNHQLITFGETKVNPYGNCIWILSEGADPYRPRKPLLQINTIEGIIHYAQAGMGIAELPYEHLEALPYKTNLVPILTNYKGPEVEIFYIYSKKTEDSKKIIALRDFLLEKSGGQPISIAS